jgi:hypothetical protein
MYVQSIPTWPARSSSQDSGERPSFNNITFTEKFTFSDGSAESRRGLRSTVST